MTAAEITALRGELAARGYTPVPLHGKRPAMERWERLQDVNLDQIAMWGKMWADAGNTGILCRDTPTLDVDILDRDAVDAIIEHVREKYEERGYIDVRVGLAPKAAIPFRTIAPFSKIIGNVIAPNGKPEKIEFLANGQQFVAYGIHPETQRAYTWHGSEPLLHEQQELPYINAEEAQQLVDDIVAILVHDFGYTGGKERPKKPNGNGAHGGTADWQYLYDNIAAGAELHDSLRDLAAKMIASGMAPGAAVNCLRGLMDSSTATRDERFRERWDDIPRMVAGAQEKFARAPEQPEQPPPAAGRTTRFKFKAFEEIQVGEQEAYLIQGIVPRAGLVVVWGPPKCGKSFVVYDMAMHVALGREYRGQPVKQGAVVYLALEGGSGFARRVEAWRQHHQLGNEQKVPFYLLDVPVNVIADHPVLVAALRDQVPDVPNLIVIDTLNRGLVGDENNPKDMGAFIRAADNMRVAFPECTVLLVHHCGVEGTRPRGHTSLTGANDGQVGIRRDAAGLIRVEVEWIKDGEPAPVSYCRLERNTFGVFREGFETTSCVAVEATPEDNSETPRNKLLTDKQKFFMDALASATIDAPPEHKSNVGGRPAVSREFLKTMCRSMGWIDPTKSDDYLRADVSRTITQLRAKAIVGCSGAYVWDARNTSETLTETPCFDGSPFT